MARIKDHNKVKINQLYEEYLDTCHASLAQCLQDYEDGKGVAAYYQHVGRIKAAHNLFEKKATGEHHG